jgi:RHS repeat-associated protein
LTQTTHELPAVGGLPDSGNPALRRYTQSYQYDGVGNLLEMKHQLGSGGSVLWKRDYAYASGSNRLLTTSMGQSSLSYDYDARGALSNLPHLQGFTRDFRDQLRRVVLDLAGNEAWYAHDGAGQRVRKLVDKGATTEERIYVGGWEVWRKRVNGTLDEERTTLHVRDGERRVAMVETKTVAGGQAVGAPVARWRFQLDDHLGSAVSECDDQGGVFSYEELHPYGSVAWSAVDAALDVSPRRYRYTGMERDEETGLQAHGVRMYAPWLGRWDRPDPIGLGDGVNRWGYCHQSPSARRDTNGRESPPPQDTHQRPDPNEPEEVFIYAEHGLERMGIGEFLMLPFAKPVQEFTAWYASKTPAGRLLRRAAEAYPEEAAAVAGAVDVLTDNEATRVIDDATFGLTGIAVAKQGWRAFGVEMLPDGGGARSRRARLDYDNHGGEFVDDGLRTGDDWQIVAPEAGENVASKAPLEGASPKIAMGKQGKHIPGHNNYTPGRSVLSGDAEELGRAAGTGQQVGKTQVGLPGSKERVVYDDVIGQYVDDAGNAVDTNVGIIHYSKDGIHIVPGRPQ